MSKIWADTKTHPLKKWYKLFLKRCNFFCKSTILFLHVPKLFGTVRMESGATAEFWYDALVILMKHRMRGTAPPQHLHVGAAPQASTSPP